MLNFSQLMGLKGKIDVLKANHPKFVGFVNAVNSRAIKEGTVMEIKVTTPEGEVIETAIKLQASDLEALNDIADMAKNAK